MVSKDKDKNTNNTHMLPFRWGHTYTRTFPRTKNGSYSSRAETNHLIGLSYSQETYIEDQRAPNKNQKNLTSRPILPLHWGRTSLRTSSRVQRRIFNTNNVQRESFNALFVSENNIPHHIHENGVRNSRKKTDQGQTTRERDRQRLTNWRRRITSEEAAQNLQIQLQQEQLRLTNMTSKEKNNRLNRRRIAQQLRRSILPPNHMGSVHYQQRHQQDRGYQIAARHNPYRIHQLHSKTTSNASTSDTSQYIHPTIVGKLTRVPATSTHAPYGCFEHGSSSNATGNTHSAILEGPSTHTPYGYFEQGSSSNATGNTHPTILEGLTDDELLHVWDEKSEDEFFYHQQKKNRKTTANHQVRKNLIFSPGWSFSLQVDNYFLRKIIVKELISQLEPSDKGGQKKRRQRRHVRANKENRLFYRIRKRRKCTDYRRIIESYKRTKSSPAKTKMIRKRKTSNN